MNTVHPTTDETVAEWSGDQPAILRLSVELSVDCSPLAAYAALTPDARDPASYAFLLESADKIDASDPDGAFQPGSARPDRHARFSFVGYDPVAAIRIDPDDTDISPLRNDPLVDHVGTSGDGVVDRMREALPPLQRVGFGNGSRQLLEGGLVGYLTYDAVYDMWLEDVGVSAPDTDLPDAEFVLTTSVLTFDEVAGTCELVCTPLVTDVEAVPDTYESVRTEGRRIESRLRDAAEPTFEGFEPTASSAGAESAYLEAVTRAKEHVLDGDIYQGVLSRERVLHGDIDPRGFYAALRDINPSPYMYLLEFGPRSVVGASPETLVSVRGETVTSNPIAGTCPRGESPVEDRRLAGEMLADEKELAEHTMLVDLARNDVRRVARPGSVRVDEFMGVLKYSHVQHIESTVTGSLANDADAYDVIKATFPAGTLAGAPKIRAMEIIDDLEESPRGIYGGGVGYVSWTGDTDFAIAIRSAMVEQGSPDRVTVRAGAGIVADSDPAAEYAETEAKMDAVLQALERLSPSTGGSD